LLARVLSGAVLGIDAYLVTVEADVASGLPAFFTVGLPQGAVKEGRERVIAAVQNSGYLIPPKRVTINLAPADVTKVKAVMTRDAPSSRLKTLEIREKNRGDRWPSLLPLGFRRAMRSYSRVTGRPFLWTGGRVCAIFRWSSSAQRSFPVLITRSVLITVPITRMGS
jgi:hypothetical protein